MRSAIGASLLRPVGRGLVPRFWKHGGGQAPALRRGESSSSFCRSALAALLATLLLAGCTPATTRDAAPAPSVAAPRQPKSLTIALKDEPSILISTHVGGAYTLGRSMRMALHQRLATFDDRGDVHPQLALELPTIESGTWVVRPDGTMQTTYRIRPGVTWHDGTPLTAHDFVFAWQVTNDQEIPMGQRSVAPSISGIATPDDHTLVMEWTRTDPSANGIAEEGVGPFPAHLLERTYQADKERFQVLPYWSREFVGLGPYRLAEWVPASHMVLRAYDAFYAGPPKIDTITFRFIPSVPTVVANLLAGTVDGAIPPAIDFGQASVVRSEWERAGKAPLAVLQPMRYRMIAAQFRDTQPREVLDARVRRALLHAIDRQALTDALFAGQVPIADSFIPPDDVKWDWVKDVATRYEYSPTRALQLLADAGWRPGADGALLDRDGKRVSLSLWTDPGELETQQLAIVDNQWKALGLGVEDTVLSSGQARDNRVSASFPAFALAQLAIGAETTLLRLHSSNCPVEETRFTGPNAGCYRNPEHDRIVDTLRSAIDPGAQRQLYHALVDLQTQELPVLPLYFDVEMTLFRQGVTGVRGDTRPRTSATWNVSEWDVS
ncbi:MAG: peptide/nickel transport system substrate-binding protein [Chloroflexota bacterium]|jgi:peptide/nickel transport system substrate-binding protein|nr:peptide/nickel transport system substrate-binding protein [Chloroflexota bacterium]